MTLARSAQAESKEYHGRDTDRASYSRDGKTVALVGPNSASCVGERLAAFFWGLGMRVAPVVVSCVFRRLRASRDGLRPVPNGLAASGVRWCCCWAVLVVSLTAENGLEWAKLGVLGVLGVAGRSWAWLGLYVAWKAQRRDRRGPEAGLAQLHARGKAGATSANTQQEQPVGTMDGALPLARRRTVALSPNTIANTDNT